MRIAIHQPNFCPTKSYFDKIASVDLFVIMVHCQWEKGKYQNRFHVGKEWNTMSVNRGLEPIMDKRYLNPKEDWDRITKRYPKMKVFDDAVGFSLAQTNVGIIAGAMKLLNIKTEAVCDYPTELLGTARLVDICKRHEATEYLSGTSGRHYIDLKQFERAGINVLVQEPQPVIPLIDLI